jgi:hypothetical protein
MKIKSSSVHAAKAVMKIITISKKACLPRSFLPITLVTLLSILHTLPVSRAQSQPSAGETIVMVRHGEKPLQGLGQLTCKGLNRALALPNVLIGRYGRPDFIYAPNPSVQVSDSSNVLYSYVRPLITIEPTAIRLAMPVNTQIGYADIDKLQKELTRPEYANSLIFVAWEHIKLYQFAQQMLRSNGKDPSAVPAWPNSDYDTIYVFHIVAANGKPEVTFTIAKEMLNNSLSDACPAR